MKFNFFYLLILLNFGNNIIIDTNLFGQTVPDKNVLENIPCKDIFERWYDKDLDYWQKDSLGYFGFRHLFIDRFLIWDSHKCNCDSLKLGDVLFYMGKPDSKLNCINLSNVDSCRIGYLYNCIQDEDMNRNCLFRVDFYFKKSDSLIYEINHKASDN